MDTTSPLALWLLSDSYSVHDHCIPPAGSMEISLECRRWPYAARLPEYPLNLSLSHTETHAMFMHIDLGNPDSLFPLSNSSLDRRAD